MNMRRAFVLTILFGCTATGYADLRIQEKVEGNAGKLHVTGTQITEIRGNQMRVETQSGSDTQVILYDLGAQTVSVFDTKRKEVRVRNIASIQQETSKVIPLASISFKYSPAGASRSINGLSCDVYDFSARIPVTEDGKPTLIMTGSMCVSKNANGVNEYHHFVATANQLGAIIGYTNNNLVFVAMAYAETSIYRVAEAIGGIPLEISRKIQFEGGMFAGLLNRSAGERSLELTGLSDSVLSPVDFDIPNGWKRNETK